jgi:hypothetical protein
MTSIKEKHTKDGHPYKDKLFTSIQRSQDTQETRFYYYKVNESEAVNVISALPLLVRDELGLDTLAVSFTNLITLVYWMGNGIRLAKNIGIDNRSTKNNT